MRRALRNAILAGDLDAWAPHAAALFFGAGSAIAVLVAVLPGRDHPGVSVAIGVLGLVSALAVLVCAPRIGRRALNALLAVGTLCVALGGLTAADPLGPDAMLFVWVGLYAGFFLGVPALAAHVGVVALTYAVVLLVHPGAASTALLPQALVLVVGAVVTAGAWSALLRRVAETLLDRQRRLASTDGLTGLVNRGELVRHGAARVQAGTGAWAIVVVDLDGFKIVNDTLGHAAGDDLLRAAAARLRLAVPDGAVAARLGGDEFGVLLDGLGAEETAEVARRLHEALDAPYRVGGTEIRAAGSVGVALGGPRHVTFDDALRDADLAMYVGKRDGGGWRTFAPAMRDAAREERSRARELHRAIGRDLSLRFQPMVEPGSGRAAVVEALVRWEHPEDGARAPAGFVPLAERNGLIVPLGRWVLREACVEAASWPHEVAVSVNLAPAQLADPALVGDVREALADAGLAAERLILEVTESTIMARPEDAAARLGELRALGAGVAIDDFGTGHSSLAALQQLPVTDLKLAREFVSPLEDPAHDAALPSAIIALGHALGLRITGEGVERESQLARLRELRCDLVQGFLLARPMPARALGDWFAGRGSLEPAAPRRRAPVAS